MSGWEQIINSESEEEEEPTAKVAKLSPTNNKNGSLLGNPPPPPNFQNQQQPIQNNNNFQQFPQFQQTFQNPNNHFNQPPNKPPSWNNQTNGNNHNHNSQPKGPIPSYPNSLFDIFERKIKEDDMESLTFFHYEINPKDNSVELFLNQKRYFIQPNRKIPCDLKHILAKYIFQEFDHGDVKYPFDESKIENVLQEIYQWDASNKFIELEPDASFEEVDKTEDNVTVLLEIDDEEILRTMASSMELARNIASKQMLNSEKYRQKYIDLLKKEATLKKSDYEFSGPVIEKFGNPRHDPHIRDRLNNKKNVHLDVICGNM